MIDINKIEKDLEELPDKIRKQAEDTALKNKEVDIKKLEYDVSYGMSLIKAQASNATEKKAIATEASKNEAMNLIEAKYNSEVAKASLNYLENSYISARKLGSIYVEQMKSNISGF